MTTTRLIIITVPPLPIREAIQALREPLCRAHNAGWALQYPPHVTLRTGVIVPNEKLPEVFLAFGRLLAGTPPLTITTDPPSFGRMEYENENHFFLYLPVRMNAALAELNRRLLTYRDYRKSDKQAFSPHLTLFWGDVPTLEESRIREYIDNKRPPFAQRYSWLCDSVSLYAQTGDSWQERKQYTLQFSPESSKV